MWTRKDWIDLLLMVLGAIIGVGIIGFVVGPAFGIEFSSGKPAGYMMAAATGTLCSYLFRRIVKCGRRN